MTLYRSLMALPLALTLVTTPARATVEDDLRRLSEQWAAARVARDAKFLESFYARELQLYVADGSRVDRDVDIALFANNEIRPEYIRLEDLKVMVFGDTATVAGIEHLKGTYKGYPGKMALRFLDVLVKRDGKWQLVARQTTKIRDE
ncbi:MAG: nuclear transport factor 2 family protein [Sphingomonas sp.]|nr:nuclear transport factor 2 family protein [Sphingomonas sp.]